MSVPQYEYCMNDIHNVCNASSASICGCISIMTTTTIVVTTVVVVFFFMMGDIILLSGLRIPPFYHMVTPLGPTVMLYVQLTLIAPSISWTAVF